VECLGGEDQGVEVEVGVLRVPAAVGYTAELAEQFSKVNVPGQRDAVFPVRRENVVLRLARPARSDLGCFLSCERNPQGQLPLPLEGGGLNIEPADCGHVRVQPAQALRRELVRVLAVDRVSAELPVRSQQLHHLRRGLAHDGFRVSFPLVVYRCSVELGGRQMCAHTVSLLAASGCNAMSLGYMPSKE
jgi:hypothetical protein